MVTLAFGAMLAPAMAAAQDADKKVAGGGDLAPGWQMRVDPRAGRARRRSSSHGLGLPRDDRARARSTGVPADVAEGQLQGRGTFTLSKATGHAEAYGLVFAGKDLTGPTQNYMYFTLGGNGTYPDQASRRRRRNADSHGRGLDAERCDREGGCERQEHGQARSRSSARRRSST